MPCGAFVALIELLAFMSVLVELGAIERDPNARVLTRRRRHHRESSLIIRAGFAAVPNANRSSARTNGTVCSTNSSGAAERFDLQGGGDSWDSKSVVLSTARSRRSPVNLDELCVGELALQRCVELVGNRTVAEDDLIDGLYYVFSHSTDTRKEHWA